MKIRLGFVSNSSSSSFVVYNFVIIPEGVEIDALYDNLIPEEKTELRENINWGKKIDNITAKLDKESALEEVKKLIDNDTNKDEDLMKKRIFKAIEKIVDIHQTHQFRYDSFIQHIPHIDEKAEKIIEKAKKLYPYANRSYGDVYTEFMEECKKGKLYFIKDEYQIDDNHFIGRRKSLVKKDDTFYIDGKTAPLKLLFPNCEISTIKWCIWSNQNSVDEDFFDDIDKPTLEQARDLFKVEDERLLSLLMEFGVMHWDCRDEIETIVREIDDITNSHCSDATLKAARNLLEAIAFEY